MIPCAGHHADAGHRHQLHLHRLPARHTHPLAVGRKRRQRRADAGRLVADEPAAQADQDRSSGRPPRPRHHLPIGRGRRHRRHGPGHPCRHPSIAGAAVMCMTLKLPESERKRQDRFVRRADKRVCSTKLTQRRGPIHPHSSVPATEDEAWRAEHLNSRQNQATFTSSGKPLGETRLSVQRDIHASTQKRAGPASAYFVAERRSFCQAQKRSVTGRDG